LVGSSSSSRSGFWSSSRVSATRRRSPPESVSTFASPGGQRSASIATSSVRSSSQAPTASIWSWSFACSSISLFIASSSSGSANFALMSSKRWSSARTSATPCCTLPSTSSDGSSWGSCGRKPTRTPGVGRASPTKSWSTPAMMRSSELLPAPFAPSTPIFAPGRNASVMSSRMMRSPDTTLRRSFIVNTNS
jgi:hypothetical protein